MDVFLAAIIMMTTLAVAFFLFMRNVRAREDVGARNRVTMILLIGTALLVLCDLLCGRQSLPNRLPFDLILALAPMMLVTSSLWNLDKAVKVVWYLVIPLFVTSLYYILQATGLLPWISAEWYLDMVTLGAIQLCVLFFVSVYLRVREVRLVLKSGNVWSVLCLIVEATYLVFALCCVMLLHLVGFGTDTWSYVCKILVSFLLTGELVALGMRTALDSVFVICHRHERRIVESMRISHVEVAQDSSRIDEMYREIYERVVTLFENDKPYLNSELTINDIVKVIFTNKLYISRAISQFTGRNFCQFVNYYRVTHSIQTFRDNPELKVAELASQSGFNSTVSFSMAFRLYMAESPSDWCRKEKLKLGRKKK